MLKRSAQDVETDTSCVIYVYLFKTTVLFLCSCIKTQSCLWGKRGTGRRFLPTKKAARLRSLSFQESCMIQTISKVREKIGNNFLTQ